jgi:DNA-binding NtrC family response regulator
VNATALLLSRDANSLVLCRRALTEFGLQVEVETGTRTATTTLVNGSYGTIIVDCDDLDGGKEFLHWAVRERSKEAIIIAITNHVTTLHEAFNIGATFVLQKPLSPERVVRCVRATSDLLSAQDPKTDTVH